MKRYQKLLLLFISVCSIFLASCESGEKSSSATLDATGLSFDSPPLIKQLRAIDSGTLFAEVTLEYLFELETFTSVKTANRGGGDQWKTSVDVPADTPFTLEIRWYDLTDGSRLDLTRRFWEIEGYSSSSQVVLEYGFQNDYNYADEFNEDGDVLNNLEELIAGTDPYVPNGPTQPSLDDVKISLLEEQSKELDFAGFEDIAAIDSWRWSAEPVVEGGTEGCDQIAGFDADLAAASLDAACTVPENCTLAFDQLMAETDAVRFKVTVPPLKASVNVDYQLEAIGAGATEPTVIQYSFCLVAINEPPTAVNDSFTVTEGVRLVISADQGVNLLSNDTDDEDVSNNPLSINLTPVRAPERATEFTLESDGGFSYLFDINPETAAADDLSDSFEYAVTDGINTSTATVTLDIVSTDRPPVQTDEIPAQQVVVGIDTSFDLSVYFMDPENSELAFSADDAMLPPSGGITVTEVGILSGAAQAGDEGTYSIAIEVRDQMSAVTGTLALEVVANQRPVASPIADSPTLESGESLSVNVAQYFSDPEGEPLSFALGSSPESGLQINSDTGLITGQIAAAGVYTLTVSASDGVTEPVSSSFTVTQLDAQLPVLSVSPTSLSLSAEVSQSENASINIGNDGNAPLDYEVGSNQPWLSAGPVSGTVAGGESEDLSVTAQCGEAETTRSGVLTIGSNGGSASVAVSIVCSDVPVAILTVNPVSLSLGADVNEADKASISLGNDGNAQLEYQVGSDQNWLSASPVSGTIAGGKSEDLSVTAQCGEVGTTRSGTLTIRSNGGSVSVSVSIVCSEVQVAELCNLDPESLSLSAQIFDSAESSIRFSNCGRAALKYEVTFEPEFPYGIGDATLTVKPESGSIASEGSDSLNVVLECDFATNSSQGTLTINAFDGGVRKIPVTYDCTPETFSVGDRGPAGGIVFHVFENGLQGLEAAPEDQITAVDWGCNRSEIVGADDPSIGSGDQNTLDILAGCEDIQIAAREAYSYTYFNESTGFMSDDWFLPSRLELQAMVPVLLKLSPAEGGINGDGTYWSSTEIVYDQVNDNGPDQWVYCTSIFNSQTSIQNGLCRKGLDFDIGNVKDVRNVRVRAVRKF